MAKGNNNGKPKKSHSYKPYDSSNSFVKRVTSRVSEFLPQPSSWISRWLLPAAQSERQQSSQYERDSDEEDRVQPPSKRLCLTNNAISDYTHRNNIRQLDERRSIGEEISPILSSRQDDSAVAGPSGLHLRRKDRFVSSTPAVSTIPPPVSTGLDKVNGDDGSDSSDSTSGCSSLVPQADKTSSFSAKRNLHSTDTANISSSSSLSISKNPRSLFCKPKYPRVDFPTTPEGSVKGGMPTFNSLVFQSSFKNRSLNESTLKDDVSNASPFYRGRTMYGGASSCSEALHFAPSISLTGLESPQVINIKPQNTPETSTRDTMGTTARKILDALEKFSTPVLDAKRIPVKKPSSNLKPSKRRLHQPYQELSIPQMPALLRIKRRESLQNRTTTSSDDSTTTPELPQQPEQEYSLRKPEDTSSQKYLGSIKRKGKEKIESVPAAQVNLPAVSLPITSLPVINISVKPPQPQVSKQLTVTNPPKPLSQFDYKFSEPIIESHNTSSIDSILPTISFSDPLQPNEVSSTTGPKHKCIKTNMTPSKDTKFTDILVKKNETPSVLPTLMKTSSNTFQLIRKSPKEDNSKTSILGSLKPPTELKLGSVMDILGAKSKGFGDKFKPPEGSWQCKICCVNNNKDKEKCVACETPKEGKDKAGSIKGFGTQLKMPSDKWECGHCLVRNNARSDKCVSCSKTKPGKAPEILVLSSPQMSVASNPAFGDIFKYVPAADSWECKECFLRNKLSDGKCVACANPKPGGVPGVKPSSELKNIFRKPEGSWECGTCLVQNKSEVNACVACGNLKPGATVPEKNEPFKAKFSFGIPPSSSTVGGFSVSNTVTNTTSQPSTGGFFFNMDKGSSKNNVVPASNFKFGIPLNSSVSETKNKSSESDAADQASKPFTSSESLKPSTGVNCCNTTPPETTLSTAVPPLPLTGTLVNFNSTTNTEHKVEKEKEEKQPAKKRVSFGEPLVEEKKISNETNSSELFSFGSSSASTTKVESQSTNSVVPTKPSIFGNNATFVPTTSSSPFTSLFNATSSTSSHLPAASSAPLSTFNSSKSVSSTTSFSTPVSSNSFTGDKKVNPLFGFLTDKTKQFNSDNQTPFNSSTTPSDSKVIPSENISNNKSISSLGSNNEQCNIFGGNSDNKPGLFNMTNNTEEKKPNFFASPAPATENFFNDNINVFGDNQTDSWGAPKPVFSSNAEPTGVFGTATPVNTTATFSGFGTNTPSFASGNDNKGLFAFDSLQQNQTTAPTPTNSLFTFKSGPEKPQQNFAFPAATTTQTSGSFVFSAPQTSSANQPSSTYSTPSYGASHNQTPPTFGSSSGFGNSGTIPPPLFSFNSSAPSQPERPASSVFTFGAHQAPAKEASSSTASFSFGSQNASGPASGSGSAPTPFDPNIKPNFNFSGGAAPTFTAVAIQSSDMPTPKTMDRKIRRAIRRTTTSNR